MRWRDLREGDVLVWPDTEGGDLWLVLGLVERDADWTIEVASLMDARVITWNRSKHVMHQEIVGPTVLAG